MILDLKKVTLGYDLDDDTLWVIEQVPGLVVGDDQTTILRAGRYIPRILGCGYRYFRTFMRKLGNLMPEVEPTGQRGRTAALC